VHMEVGFFDGIKVVESVEIEVNITGVSSKADWTAALFQAILTYANDPSRNYGVTNDDIFDLGATLAPQISELKASVDGLTTETQKLQTSVTGLTTQITP